MASGQVIISLLSDNSSFEESDSVASDLTSDLYISEQVYTIVLTIVNGAVVPAISVFGMTGNLITMLVLYIMGFKDTTDILLFSLAICDFLFLALACVRRVQTFLYFVDPNMAKDYSAYTQVYLFTLSRLVLFLSISQIACIAIERFVAVFFPFKVSVWITKKRMIIALVLLYITLFSLVFPLFLRFQIEWRFDESRNQTVPVSAYTDFYIKHTQPIDVYGRVLPVGVGAVGSLLIVSICSAAVSLKLLQANKKQRAMSAMSASKEKSQRTKEMKVSRMLLTVCLVYLTTNIPTILFLLAVFATRGITVLSRIYIFLSSITEVCNVINSSANFVIYIFLASKFYDTLKGLACC